MSDSAKTIAFALVVMPFYTEDQKTARAKLVGPWFDIQHKIEKGEQVSAPQDWFAVVHRGQVEAGAEQTVLEKLFHTFNQEELPESYRGPSLSTGHFVWLDVDGGSYWLCTSMGWHRWTHWGEELLTRDCTELSHK